MLYGCETWSLTLREERRLRVFENRVLRRIIVSKSNGNGEWKRPSGRPRQRWQDLIRMDLKKIRWIRLFWQLIWIMGELYYLLYGCKTRSLTLGEDGRLRIFEYRILGRIFGPSSYAIREWRRFLNEELHSL